MYRLLEPQGESRERRDQLTHPPYQKPELLATEANLLWTWDVTKLRGPVKGTAYPADAFFVDSRRYQGRLATGQRTSTFALYRTSRRILFTICNSIGVDSRLFCRREARAART